MKSTFVPSLHIQALVGITPSMLALSAIVTLTSYLLFQPPAWVFVTAIATGIVYAFALFPYWRNPSNWKFGLLIGSFVSLQGIICNRITPKDASFLEYLAPVIFFLGILFCCVFHFTYKEKISLCINRD